MMKREEHLEACKQRARKHLDRFDYDNALISMFCDLDKHEETKNHPGIDIGIRLQMIGSLASESDARRFIEGFN